MPYKYYKLPDGSQAPGILFDINGDGSFIMSIPNDPDNRDWRIFQAWLSADEANVPVAAE